MPRLPRRTSADPNLAQPSRVINPTQPGVEGSTFGSVVKALTPFADAASKERNQKREQDENDRDNIDFLNAKNKFDAAYKQDRNAAQVTRQGARGTGYTQESADSHAAISKQMSELITNPNVKRKFNLYTAANAGVETQSAIQFQLDTDDKYLSIELNNQIEEGSARLLANPNLQPSEVMSGMTAFLAGTKKSDEFKAELTRNVSSTYNISHIDAVMRSATVPKNATNAEIDLAELSLSSLDAKFADPEHYVGILAPKHIGKTKERLKTMHNRFADMRRRNDAMALAEEQDEFKKQVNFASTKLAETGVRSTKLDNRAAELLTKEELKTYQAQMDVSETVFNNKEIIDDATPTETNKMMNDLVNERDALLKKSASTENTLALGVIDAKLKATGKLVTAEAKNRVEKPFQTSLKDTITSRQFKIADDLARQVAVLEQAGGADPVQIEALKKQEHIARREARDASTHTQFLVFGLSSDQLQRISVADATGVVDSLQTAVAGGNTGEDITNILNDLTNQYDPDEMGSVMRSIEVAADDINIDIGYLRDMALFQPTEDEAQSAKQETGRRLLVASIKRRKTESQKRTDAGEELKALGDMTASDLSDFQNTVYNHSNFERLRKSAATPNENRKVNAMADRAFWMAKEYKLNNPSATDTQAAQFVSDLYVKGSFDFLDDSDRYIHVKLDKQVIEANGYEASAIKQGADTFLNRQAAFFGGEGPSKFMQSLVPPTSIALFHKENRTPAEDAQLLATQELFFDKLVTSGTWTNTGDPNKLALGFKSTKDGPIIKVQLKGGKHFTQDLATLNSIGTKLAQNHKSDSEFLTALFLDESPKTAQGDITNVNVFTVEGNTVSLANLKAGYKEWAAKRPWATYQGFVDGGFGAALARDEKGDIILEAPAQRVSAIKEGPKDADPIALSDSFNRFGNEGGKRQRRDIIKKWKERVRVSDLLTPEEEKAGALLPEEQKVQSIARAAQMRANKDFEAQQATFKAAQDRAKIRAQAENKKRKAFEKRLAELKKKK